VTMMICELLNEETTKIRYESTERSAFLVKRCATCELIHLVVFKDADGPPSWCVDFSSTFVDQLIPELLKCRAQFPTESGHTAPEQNQ
jgi:hypothetical protein